MKDLINIKDLSIGYNKALMENINFSIEEGDFIVIVGKNGIGKSTLIKTILGINKKIKGEIEYSIDKNLIGYVSQENEVSKDFPANVYEVVLSGNVGKLRSRFFYNKKEKENTKNIIKKIGLDDKIKEKYNELSGGQKQRVKLGRALVGEKKVLFLDEVVNGLDTVIRRDLYATLKELNEKEKISIVLISHDINVSIDYGNKFLYFNDDVKVLNKNEIKKYMKLEEEI